MASKIKVDTLETANGSGSITLNNPIAGFTSTGIDDNATSTAVTIDASENVLVGKTAQDMATVGAQFRGDAVGLVQVTRDGGEALHLNRLSSDGNVLSVYKDTALKGSIAVTASGIGIQLGGTGAANTLDDYEEGTWTGTLTGATSSPSTPQTATGSYTKVGRLCTVSIEIANKNTSGASGGLRVTGLPFTSSISAFGSYVSYGVADYSANAINTASWLGSGSAHIDFYDNTDSGVWSTTQIVAGSLKYLYLSLTYQTS
jgi:hypothetical protein